MNLTNRPLLTPSDIKRAWQTGKLCYRYREVQRIARVKWIESQKISQKFYLEANRRFGKSSFFLLLLAEGRIKNAGSKAGFYAPVKEGLRDYVIPIIEKTFSDCPENLRPILDSHLTLNFPNGSSVIFRGSNNLQHRVRRGNDLEEAVIDEARDVDDLQTLIDSVVVPSLFTAGGRLLIGSTPADTDDHDLHAIKLQAEKEGWYHHADIYDCNKHDPDDFPLERIEQWKKETTDTVAWDREYMALWVKDPSKIIIPEWQDSFEQIPAHDECFQFYHKYVGLDSGVRDKTAAIFGYYDFLKARLIIESEFTRQDAAVRSDLIAEDVKRKERELNYQILHDRKDPKYAMLSMNEKVNLRVADNNDPILINDLNGQHKLDFIATHKDSLEAMINLVRLWVKDGRILVDKSCKELIGCLRNAIWDKNKKELARSKVYGHFDALMALVYLVRNVDTHTNPIPQFYGKTAYTHANVPLVAPYPSTSSYNLARALAYKPTLRDKSRENFVRGNMS